MKLTIFFHLFLVMSIGSVSLANTCVGEAQIIAKIQKTVFVSPTECKGFIDPKSVEFFSSSQTCPLTIDEVLANGITPRHIDQGVCAFIEGDTVNGIIFVDADHNIRVED
jgi:hypothetical protein